MTLRYPAARETDDVVKSAGQAVPDPYRWLEDLDSAETRAWIAAQQALTQSVLGEIPAREEIVSQLTEIWDVATRGVPRRRGKRWFQWRNSGLQNQPVLYVMDSPQADGKVVLDPNTLSAAGTVAVNSASFTEDGALIAYGVCEAGSDWTTWRVREVESGADLPDAVEWSKFCIAAWKKDGSGFYYNAYPVPAEGDELTQLNTGQHVRFHRLGTPQSEDPIVFESPDNPDIFPAVEVTDDGRFLVLSTSTGAANEMVVHIQDLTAEQPAWVLLAGDVPSFNAVIGNEGDQFYLVTDLEAPLRRIVRVSLADPSRDKWQEVVPEGEHQLTIAAYLGGRLVCQRLKHGAADLSVVGTDGQPREHVDLPPFSAITEIDGHAGDPLFFVTTTSLTDRISVWSHDLDKGETALVYQAAASRSGLELVTEQVFIDSLDGTKVPAFLVHRADVTPTGDVPVWLTGYGGFNIPKQPLYQVPYMVWVERGGLFVMATLRGGGEYGVEWHDNGRRANKQNVFDDFASVARWLHTSGWSQPSKIAIQGGSNGGLLVGASITQHPELFGAAVPEVGVLDMLRFHHFTCGRAWMPEYGDPDDPIAFEWLRRYSPLHNVRAGGRYPATLVMTGDHDDRVVPGHSFKFAAALQAAQGAEEPVLIRVETSTGHGLGKPVSKAIGERADVIAFLEHAMSVKPKPSATLAAAGEKG